MHQICLHLYSPDIATRYIQALRGEEDPRWSWWEDDLPMFLTRAVSEIEANKLTSGIALAMAEQNPTFFYDSCGLTTWEAMIDRGVGMMMRPPARIFVDHGHNPYLINSMPIRLDMQGGFPMAGAWVPPHLLPRLYEMIETRMDLWARRIHEAELDPYPLLTTLHMAAEEAMKHGLGLIESMDVLPPGSRVVETPDRKKMDPEMRARIQAAISQDRQGLIDKLFRRGS
jgi:hypothetical protein